MKTDSRKDQLLDQQLALSAYLKVMLQAEVAQQSEVPADVEAVPAMPAEKTPAVEQSGPAKTGSVDGVPDWATTRFQALLFDVAGLTLAVPLIKLKGVVPNEAGLTPMRGWALACDSIGEVIDLETKDVKWRGANGKRAWLAGTVIEQMCALLDIDALTDELVNGLA